MSSRPFRCWSTGRAPMAQPPAGPRGPGRYGPAADPGRAPRRAWCAPDHTEPRQQAAGLQLHAMIVIAAGAAQHVQELDGGMDVAQVGHIGVDHGASSRMPAKRMGRAAFLEPADIYGPFERRTAFDNELVHQDPRAACRLRPAAHAGGCGSGPVPVRGLVRAPAKHGVWSRYRMLVFFL